MLDSLETNINYSVIIPHKNIPQLLQRCLDSIPRRDDLEIIIVDDNSDKTIVDFEHFPGLDRNDTIFFFDKTGKGAGHARNIGIEHAHGQWIIFADADDYFNYCIRDILSEYQEDESDVIFFTASCADSETYNNGNRADSFNHFFNEYINNHDEKNLRYVVASPCVKFIKKSLLINNKIEFPETVKYEDVEFSYLVGHYANVIKGDCRAFYCITSRPESLSNKNTRESILDNMRVMAGKDCFLRKNHIMLPECYLHNYRHTLIEVAESGDTELYSQCLDELTKFGISRQEEDDIVKKHLKRRFSQSIILRIIDVAPWRFWLKRILKFQ